MEHMARKKGQSYSSCSKLMQDPPCSGRGFKAVRIMCYVGSQCCAASKKVMGFWSKVMILGAGSESELFSITVHFLLPLLSASSYSACC